MIFLGQTFQPRGEIDRVADDGKLHFFGRTEVANDYFALVDADAESEFEHPARFPVFVELFQAAFHRERRGHGIQGVWLRPLADDAAPDGHDGVANKFVERALMREHVRDHFLEIFVELFDQRVRVGALSEGGESAHIREEHRDRLAHAAERVEKRLRIVEQFLDDVAGDVAFEGPAHAALFEAFEQVIVGQGGEAA